MMKSNVGAQLNPQLSPKSAGLGGCGSGIPKSSVRYLGAASSKTLCTTPGEEERSTISSFRTWLSRA